MSMSPVLFARSAWSPRADPHLMNDTDGAGSNGTVPNKEKETAMTEPRGEANTLEGMMGYAPHAERVMRVYLSIYRCLFHRFNQVKHHIHLFSKWRHLLPLLIQAYDGYQTMSGAVSNVHLYNNYILHLIYGRDLQRHGRQLLGFGKINADVKKTNT